MTNEQKQALDRVKATYAYGNDIDSTKGIYVTEDMMHVLNLMETSFYWLKTINDTLKELKNIESSKKEEIINNLIYCADSFLNEETKGE